MCVALWGIEEKIANFRTRNMRVLGSDISEDYPRGSLFTCPSDSCLPEIPFTKIWESQ